MRKIGFYVTALVASVLASCSNEENIVSPVEEAEQFVAVIAEGESRTSLDTDGQGVLWNTTDDLTIFRKNAYNYKYILTSGEGTKSATFKFDGENYTAGSATGIDKYYAVYPYNEDIVINENKEVTVSIPSIQAYTAGTYDPKAAFMFAESDNTTLSFKNAHALLKVVLAKMPGDADYEINSIELSSDNVLSGNAKISMMEEEANRVPSVTIADNGTKSLTLNCGNGVIVNKEKLTEADAVFYLVVTPGTYSNLKLTLNGDNGYKKELRIPTEKSTIKRNSILTIEHVCGNEEFTGGIEGFGSTGQDAAQ